ncbi:MULTISPECIES: LysR family transcriptional regulator [Rhizobium]|uniref:HTH-type transcriptional regulator TtuA n=1 Tax=Rhizobium leguminosarum TaxID=384 RepID=A0ABD7PUC7_RHILE|nr:MULTISPECIES: LysR family transcriptional regulator [Rhizobium]KPN26925.1 LysR family transcriptional regulator [Rhizobium brockwellii]MDV4156042.1 LysR family transcriptional regulator [Rhizobium brockwellii]QJX06010.1 LysR family transcriptional regulator [Rhizobium brockwellii]TAV74486.1 LysR family transcriptional regulator [Rhizobium leguminosarum]TAV79085.1 LysR family transcriptional regulator [Rhizobium leguminosarum]
MDIVSALRTFQRVVETGSFSAAAHDLDVTQPAVSRQVAALEGHFNTRLLHRTTSGLSLTAEGERMLPMALRILEAVEELGDAAGSDGTMASGKVRLSVPAPLGLYLSERLGDLLAAHPKLSVELIFREQGSDMIEERLDLEVRLGHVADSSLVCRRIGWTTAFLVASPAYLARRAAPRAPKEIKDHECLCYNRAGEANTWSFSNGSEDISVRISPRLTACNAVSIHRAALAGAGLAVLSHIIAMPDIAAGQLVPVMKDFQPSRLPVTVVYPSRRNMPLRVKTVLDFLIEAMGQDPSMCASGADRQWN